MYNKVAIYKFKECHPAEYSAMTVKASAIWKQKNHEKVKEYDRHRKSPFMMEWRTLRNIEVF